MSPTGYTKIPLLIDDDIEAQTEKTSSQAFKEICNWALHIIELLSWLLLVCLTYNLYDIYMTISLNLLDKICDITINFNNKTCSYKPYYSHINVHVFIYAMIYFGLLYFSEIYHPSEWIAKYKNPINSFMLMLILYMVYIDYLIYSDYLDAKIIDKKITYQSLTLSEFETYSHNIETDRSTNHISLAFPGQLIILGVLISLIVCLFKTCFNTCKSFRGH